MIPAGVIDANLELFAKGNDVFAIYSGKTIEFRNIPFRILKAIANELLRNKEAVKALASFGIVSFKDMLKKYSWCRYGAFDFNPDFDTKSGKTNTEYFDCGNRTTCPFQFIICDKFRFNGIYLTKKQIDIVKLIASGKPDKVVCSLANITYQTLLTHKKNIYSKLQLHSQSEITAFAINHNLI